MKFLQKLITEHATAQVVAEQEEVVSVEAAGVIIGEHLLFVKNFVVDGHEMRDFSHNHGVSYTSMGGAITEIVVGIQQTVSRELYLAEVYPQQPIDTSDVNVDAIRSAEINVSISTDGMQKPLDDGERTEYLSQLVRGYLIKNLASVVEATFNNEFDTQDPDNRRQMMRNREQPDFD